MSNNWKERRSRVLKQMRNDWLLYLLLVPVLAWYIIFCYLPMAGVTLAFRDYSYKGGLWGSEWVSLANFTKMFSDPLFFRAVKNTIIFSLGRIAFQMPCAILLAIALNELRLKWAKKTVQTIVTFPHFISWVVLAGMLMNIFGSTGTVNQILSALGVSNIAPITSSKAFRTFIWISGIWKEVGWDSIIYLAAITSIDPGLYEAAAVDGASRGQHYLHHADPGSRRDFDEWRLRPDLQSLFRTGLRRGGYAGYLHIPRIVHYRRSGLRLYDGDRPVQVGHRRHYADRLQQGCDKGR